MNRNETDHKPPTTPSTNAESHVERARQTRAAGAALLPVMLALLPTSTVERVLTAVGAFLNSLHHGGDSAAATLDAHEQELTAAERAVCDVVLAAVLGCTATHAIDAAHREVRVLMDALRVVADSRDKVVGKRFNDALDPGGPIPLDEMHDAVLDARLRALAGRRRSAVFALFSTFTFEERSLMLNAFEAWLRVVHGMFGAMLASDTPEMRNAAKMALWALAEDLMEHRCPEHAENTVDALAATWFGCGLYDVDHALREDRAAWQEKSFCAEQALSDVNHVRAFLVTATEGGAQ